MRSYGEILQNRKIKSIIEYFDINLSIYIYIHMFTDKVHMFVHQNTNIIRNNVR